ncbi:type II toxin-antitoxin system RelE/ParE family toxin [Pseudomonas sp. LJDD11]|uniref:type II toxin-antitoxin system RelE/ParE family toxin n=1 Tax=unclassified Pseudomonas TaxID=196821 RepID=UPI002097F181|nr:MULTISPECIES: type II toxin-antitoxin system RelE/ParE family toxin [unclassified Pseudomonas]MCO8165338.1 type II toxin-antitoxin system RelE/ParE family toxin [Pseudomonas sp. 21LCFQ010]MCQ9423532.1 type II toxin-antitoxin system RelE/ParE family toxin [Pseudomonas sp. LJDD11]
MIFIETPVFTKRAKELLEDAEYDDLLKDLLKNPSKGVLIEGTGGIRKIRVASRGRGTRGGARAIYYHFVSASRIAMLMIYAKNEKHDLSSDERKALKTIIDGWS